MSFLNKLKKGVSDTTALAKVTVEVNRLKLQVSSKKKEITELHTSIGTLVYEQFAEAVDREKEILSLCTQIQDKHFEIAAIREKIEELSDEKKCVCGGTVSRSARFCPECGHKFAHPASPSIESKQVQAETVSSAAEAVGPTFMLSSVEEEASQACGQCGEALEADAQFCGSCGTVVVDK